MPKFLYFGQSKNTSPRLCPLIAPPPKGGEDFESYRLFRNNIEPVAVLNNLVAVSNEDFTFADSDIGRVKLVE